MVYKKYAPAPGRLRWRRHATASRHRRRKKFACHICSVPSLPLPPVHRRRHAARSRPRTGRARGPRSGRFGRRGGDRQCDATIVAACRVQSEGSKWRTAGCPPTGGGLCPPMGGQGWTASARTTSANIPPRPSTHPNLGALRGGGVTSGLFRWGDRRTSSARGMIGRTTSASLVSLRGRRAQHEYEPVHTPGRRRSGGRSRTKFGRFFEVSQKIRIKSHLHTSTSFTSYTICCTVPHLA